MRASALVVCSIVVTACATHSAPRTAPSLARPTLGDTAFFAAVVRSVRDSIVEGTLFIDPRPAARDPGEPELIDSVGQYARAVAMRRFVLRQLRIPDTDVTATDGRCAAGPLAPPKPGLHSDCPRKTSTVVTITAPMPDEPSLPNVPTHDSTASAAVSDHWTARVETRVVGPWGTSYMSYVFVMAPSVTGWRLAKLVLVAALE